MRIKIRFIVLFLTLCTIALLLPTSSQAAYNDWNYGKWSQYQSPYKLVKEGTGATITTYSTQQRLVSGNRGYATQISATKSNRKDAEISAALEITEAQLKQMRFALTKANMAYQHYYGPNRTYMKTSLPAETLKRLIGPDFLQSIVYACLNQFNPTKYPAPLIWPDYYPNLSTPFSSDEIAYFLNGSLSWDDSFGVDKSINWGVQRYGLMRGAITYSSGSTSTMKQLHKFGFNYDQPLIFQVASTSDGSVFDSDNPLTARPVFEMQFGKDFYMLKGKDLASVYGYSTAQLHAKMTSETLTLQNGNQPMYGIVFDYWDTTTLTHSERTSYQNGMAPNTKASINNGSYYYVQYATVGDSVKYRTILKPDSDSYMLMFSEPPDWKNGGTVTNPIPIRTVAELEAMSRYGGNKHFKLMNNLDATGLLLQSGNFSGVFDGDNKTISNWRTSTNGLFNTLTGTVKNLSLRGFYQVNTGASGGPVAATLGIGGVIENCSVIDPDYPLGPVRLGGIVGTLDGGTIRNCTVTGGTLHASQYVGGIVGAINGAKGGTIEGCRVLGVTIESSGAVYTYNAGGIAGYLVNGTPATTTISRCEVDAATTIEAPLCIGGIVGNMVHGTISDCIASPTMKSTDTTGMEVTLGGIVGNVTQSGATCTIARCRSAATLDASSSTFGSVNNYMGGILAARSSLTTNISIVDCESGTTFVMPTNAKLQAAGIAALPSKVNDISRCIQTTPLSVAAAYTGGTKIAGVLIGGGTIDACVVSCGTIDAPSGSADAIALPFSSQTITSTNNRYAATAVSVNGTPSTTTHGIEVALVDVQGAANYGAPYNYGVAWLLDDGRLPQLIVDAAQGAAVALFDPPTGTTSAGYNQYSYARFDMDGTPIDPSKLRDGNGNPLVDGTVISPASPLTVTYAPDAPFATAGDYLYRLNIYTLGDGGYSGSTTSGQVGFPWFFDGVGVRVAPVVNETARLKVVQAGENFYARPDGAEYTVYEHKEMFTDTPEQTWILHPGYGLDTIPLKPGYYYRVRDTTPPTMYKSSGSMYYRYDVTDGFIMINNATGNRLVNDWVAIQETDTGPLFVLTRHNTLTNTATDNEVRNVTIEADPALYASVAGATFDLYMYPDLTFTSTPMFLRNVKISRDAVQDSTALFPAYYKAVQVTAPAGHTVHSEPIYFILNGSGGSLYTTSHPLNPEMRGTQPNYPVIYLPGSGDVTLHTRTLIVDDAYPPALTAPVGGNAFVDAYDPDDGMLGKRRNISMLTGFESLGIAYTDYKLPATSAAYPEYAITPIVPQYFTYKGAVVTTTDVAHASTALTDTGPFARLDASSANEFWVTFFIQPASAPGDNALEWRTNDFGEIEVDP